MGGGGLYKNFCENQNIKNFMVLQKIKLNFFLDNVSCPFLFFQKRKNMKFGIHFTFCQWINYSILTFLCCIILLPWSFRCSFLCKTKLFGHYMDLRTAPSVWNFRKMRQNISWFTVKSSYIKDRRFLFFECASYGRLLLEMGFYWR